MADISILHDVVSCAQDKLETAHGPRPLPAAALFKAYDEVLPRHGVDPDNDNHLSRLIFRIGGERGHGTLPDKFQAVLSGMGILLEFDDNSASSLAGSTSPQPHIHRIEARQYNSPGGIPYGVDASAAPIDIYADTPDNTEDGLPEAVIGHATGTPPLHGIRPEHPGRNDKQIQWANLSVEARIKEAQVSKEGMPIRQPSVASGTLLESLAHADKTPALQRPSLLSALDRWKTAIGRKRHENEHRTSPSRHLVELPRTHNEQVIEAPPAAYNSTSRIVRSSERAAGLGGSYDNVLTEPAFDHPVTQPDTHTVPSHGLQAEPDEYPILLQRAARARQIYLASRAFNHWADKTATRLEREAIARRHMIRYRCFLGWSQTPSSRGPEINHLRAITAVQKLQRAVAYQEEQLRTAALAIAKTHRLKLAKRALGQWVCSAAEGRIRQEALLQAKKRAMLSWLGQTGQSAGKRGVATKHRKQTILQRWQGRAEDDEERLEVSRQVGMVRPIFAHLRAWWDHTEVERRAQIYRANSLWVKTLRAFEDWNLSARAQAFIWRDDYVRVTCAVQLWMQASQRHARESTRANQHFEANSLPRVQNAIIECSSYNARLQHYAERARLFIFANRFLRVIDHAHVKSKARRKQEVRQQLMARYKEVSACRKRRQFESTLGKWRAAAKRSVSAKHKVESHRTLHDSRRAMAALDHWATVTDENQQTHLASEHRSIHAAINLWSNYATQQENQEMQGWDTWVQRKLRQSLKTWSISTLQGSGQAHTATMVRQRHELDKRGRAFQAWRQTSQGVENNAPLYWSRTTPRLDQGFSGRSSWRARASKLDSSYQENMLGTPLAPMETPTRWTGHPLPMGSSVPFPMPRSMPPVKEADEESSGLSSAGDNMPERNEDALRYRHVEKPAGNRSGLIMTRSAASTTPLAPVPSHLKREDVSVHGTASERRAIAVSHPALSRTVTWQQAPPNTLNVRSQTKAPAKIAARPRAPMSESRAPATPRIEAPIYRKAYAAGVRSAPQNRSERPNEEQIPTYTTQQGTAQSNYRSRARFALSKSMAESHYRTR